MDEFAKAYEPKLVEDGIYEKWLQSGFFAPENLPGERTEAFSIVLPPPNVTGTLHMGHAAMLAIEDAMIRFARLSGKKTVWIPGTDHAAIATQSKVEGMIFKEEGKTRHDLGRDEFLARVQKFAAESRNTIVDQCQKMGASLDWSREAYTLDAARNNAVNVAFKKMYDDGLIYRGYRVVNWDPVGQTTIADDEIVHKEVESTLYTFRYAKDFPIAISTTRPETKVGDTAVAVHPTDKRYKKFVGKVFDVDFCGASLSITVVADESVDPMFGTGALGVTPAHSTIDADIAARHDLPMTQVIGEDAKMMQSAGTIVAGKTTKEARVIVVDWLRENNLIESEEKTVQNLSTAERSGGAIEPLPKMQWFVSVTKEFDRHGKKATLKSLMQDAVRSKTVEILPERFEKTYFHWIDNLRDWNISRQIWFGHRVPVWYRGDEIAVGEAMGDGWEQDPDTLDTWFSSGLWTFSTLGWPDEKKFLENREFHPTTVLETGYDILFFWVARMILMSTYLLGEVPFKTVYLHGLVRDEQGRKMSKSLGNIINPLDMIAKYGADATRLSLVIGSTPGNDVKLSEEKIAGFRNFTNKLWNISRFVEITTKGLHHVESVEPNTLADRWILGRLLEVAEKVTTLHETYQLSLAGELLREFTWSDFADWYLEIAKIEKGKDDMLCYVLERLLILWHPFMPFVTEEIYARFGNGMLIVAEWPKKESGSAGENGDAAYFHTLQNIITAIRNIRAEYKVEPKKFIDVMVSDAAIVEHADIIKALARVENLTVGSKAENSVSTIVDGVEIRVLLKGPVDVAKEHARLEKEYEDTTNYIRVQTEKLANTDFVSRAPEKVITIERTKLDEAQTKAKKIEQQLASMK